MPRWHRRLSERKAGPLEPRRAASRLSAYVYGNILVLAVVVVATGATITEGQAALVVLGTGVTTYVAHIFADLLAHANIPEARELDYGKLTREQTRTLARHELRDAAPIISSAAFPAIALALGYHELIPSRAAQLLAGGIVVLRMGSVQIVTERVRGNPLSVGMVIGGVLTAAVAALIVLLKVFVGH